MALRAAALRRRRTASRPRPQPRASPRKSHTARIACAPDGSPAFDSTCTIERYELDGANLMAVFHPDGGFRRFEQLADGSGLAAVAGADAVTQTLKGDTLEIAIAANRYRFPVSFQ